MQITLDEAVFRYRILSSLIYADGDTKVSKELKIKLIRLKIYFSKYVNDFENYKNQCIEEIKTDEFNELSKKEKRTKKEDERLNVLSNEFDSELNDLINKKLGEIINVDFNDISEDEFNEILLVNAENSANINGHNIDSADYLDIFHTLFVK